MAGLSGCALASRIEESTIDCGKAGVSPLQTHIQRSPRHRSGGHTPPGRTCSSCEEIAPALDSKRNNNYLSVQYRHECKACGSSLPQQVPHHNACLGSTIPSSTSTATRNLGFLLYLRSAGALAAGAPVRNPAPSTCTLLLTAGETASVLGGLLTPGLTSCCVQELC